MFCSPFFCLLSFQKHMFFCGWHWLKCFIPLCDYLMSYILHFNFSHHQQQKNEILQPRGGVLPMSEYTYTCRPMGSGFQQFGLKWGMQNSLIQGLKWGSLFHRSDNLNRFLSPPVNSASLSKPQPKFDLWISICRKPVCHGLGAKVTPRGLHINARANAMNFFNVRACAYPPLV